MRILSAGEVDDALDDMVLIDRLASMFKAGCETPLRHHHALPEGTLLLMPAWTARRVGIKLVTVFPGNARHSLPSVLGHYMLLDGSTGEPAALLDGTMLTKRRTACASGLAAHYLAPASATRLLMIGTGALAPHLVRVHAKVRPIREVAIWGRRPVAAEDLARELARSLPGALGRPVSVRAVTDRAAAVAEADVISCATLSKEPLVEGEWLREGQHVDLVGAYTPDMRESDDNAVRRARVYVDTRAGALKEAGDIVQPLRNGTLDEADVIADLFELTRGQLGGRLPGDVSSITLFKSVGTALEDLAAAELAVEKRGLSDRALPARS